MESYRDTKKVERKLCLYRHWKHHVRNILSISIANLQPRNAFKSRIGASLNWPTDSWVMDYVLQVLAIGFGIFQMT
jgi:hypothetical protein